MGDFFASETVQTALDILKTEFPLAIWETIYVTVIATFFAIVIGLPLGVLLVAGEKGRVLRIPKWILHILNIIINLLRSIPFLILMILVLIRNLADAGALNIQGSRKKSTFLKNLLHRQKMMLLFHSVLKQTA